MATFLGNASHSLTDRRPGNKSTCFETQNLERSILLGIITKVVSHTNLNILYLYIWDTVFETSRSYQHRWFSSEVICKGTISEIFVWRTFGAPCFQYILYGSARTKLFLQTHSSHSHRHSTMTTFITLKETVSQKYQGCVWCERSSQTTIG